MLCQCLFLGRGRARRRLALLAGAVLLLLAVWLGGGALLETAGLPRTGYQQFLSALRETVPAVNGVGYRDADGAWYKRRSELSEAARASLLQYEMLQYNLLFDDEENRLADFFTLPEQNGGST